MKGYRISLRYLLGASNLRSSLWLCGLCSLPTCVMSLGRVAPLATDGGIVILVIVHGAIEAKARTYVQQNTSTSAAPRASDRRQAGKSQQQKNGCFCASIISCDTGQEAVCPQPPSACIPFPPSPCSRRRASLRCCPPPPRARATVAPASLVCRRHLLRPGTVDTGINASSKRPVCAPSPEGQTTMAPHLNAFAPRPVAATGADLDRLQPG